MKAFLLNLILVSFLHTISNSDLIASNDHRSDSIDILHTHISLDITDFSGKKIQGYSRITFTPLQNNVAHINLDLFKLNIDSVQMNSADLPHTYNDTLLGIQLGQSYNPGDTMQISIYYSGQPQIDASNWGGFYFQGGYAFNLGVGFAADPHNYGRVWFPCFDNFVERSTFSFNIVTSDGKKAYCNGDFVAETVISGDTILRQWEMHESIPSYLACVAVAEYAEVKWSHQGLMKNIPVLVAVKAGDTSHLKNSFANLNQAIDIFEDTYGPFLFNKAGFSIVPFTGGAMEHASNVTYPSFAVNGTKSYETLMAHEFAHHWWGDLVTCESQEEMWINEGMASYSEHLFLEYVYGREKYIEEVKANHLNVIQYAHIKEGKYWPISGVPHEYTYGTHVYDKGAAVGHNLRTYLGDSLFKLGINSFMNTYQFNDVNSIKLRDHLSQSTGTNIEDFFDDWVFGGGFPHFDIDSFRAIEFIPGSGIIDATAHIRQKMRGSDHFYQNVPLTLTLYDQHFFKQEIEINMSGGKDSFELDPYLVPVEIVLNEHNDLNIAVTADQKFVKNNETFDFENGKMGGTINVVGDSALFRVEHHWTTPDPIKDPNSTTRISTYRFWKVLGVFPDGLDAEARIYFDARNSTSGGNGQLDNDLLEFGTDSLILLYRKNSSEDWEEFRTYTRTSFAGVKYGFMLIENLKPGYYAFANGVSTIGVQDKTEIPSKFRISPNPVSDVLNMETDIKDTSNKTIVIYNVQGKRISSQALQKKNQISVGAWKNGSYFFVVMDQGKQIYSGQFLVSH